MFSGHVDKRKNVMCVIETEGPMAGLMFQSLHLAANLDLALKLAPKKYRK
jgi:hypothetical protein